MACYRPLDAAQLVNGDIVFVPKGTSGKGKTSQKAQNVRRELKLPCGQCIGCRLERGRQWAVRCMHESQMHEFSCFVTLTYDDENVPSDFSLRYSDVQKFLKRLRRAHGKVRFFLCGEYGESNGRPHYHALLFGVLFRDRYYWRKSSAGFNLYRSETLERLWGHGNCEIGDVSFESSAYVAGYILKKVNGSKADAHYQCVDSDTGEIFWRVPEFGRMSLKPGIGAGWFEKFGAEVYPLDRVVVNGREQKPPKYYDKLLEESAGLAFDEVAYARYLRADKLRDDSSRDRLEAREKVSLARVNLKNRSL